MTQNPQQPDDSQPRPMPPNFPAASGPQQPYASQPPYGSQQPYGSQPPYGSQQPYGSQPPYGSQQPYGSQPSYGPPQSYSVSHGAHGPAADRALFDSQLLPPQAFGTGSEGFWQPSPSDRNAAVWTHIGSILLGWLLPLILFLVKKDESPYVREHARQSLNFELTLFPIFFIGSIFTLTGVGLLILLAAAIVDIIFHVNGAIAANRGQGYRIPLAISMIK